MRNKGSLFEYSHDRHSFCTRSLNLLFALAYDPDLIGHEHVVQVRHEKQLPTDWDLRLSARLLPLRPRI